MRAEHRPYTLIAELTYRCPLHCLYCSNSIESANIHDELTTAEWTQVFREADALGVVHVNLTGGEPLLRQDLERVIAEADSLGLYTHLVTGGIPLAQARLRELAAAGLRSVQVSIQSLRPEEMACTTGGPWLEHKLRVLEWVKEFSLPLTINMVLHRRNLHEVAEMVAFAARMSADRLELANVQYAGWALRNRDALLPSHAQLDAARTVALEARDRLRGRMDILFVWPDYFREYPTSCMEGWGRRYLVVAPDGLVLPCHMARALNGHDGLSFGNVQDAALDTIWNESPAFNRFRGEEWMKEPCRACSRRTVDFGGCRCRAYSLTGDAAATDPVCRLAPSHGLIEAARLRSEQTDGELLAPAYRFVQPVGTGQRAGGATSTGKRETQ